VVGGQQDKKLCKSSSPQYNRLMTAKNNVETLSTGKVWRVLETVAPWTAGDLVFLMPGWSRPDHGDNMSFLVSATASSYPAVKLRARATTLTDAPEHYAIYDHNVWQDVTSGDFDPDVLFDTIHEKWNQCANLPV